MGGGGRRSLRYIARDGPWCPLVDAMLDIGGDSFFLSTVMARCVLSIGTLDHTKLRILWMIMTRNGMASRSFTHSDLRDVLESVLVSTDKTIVEDSLLLKAR